MFTMGGVGPAQADNGPHSIVMGQNGVTTNVSAEGAAQCANCHRAHTAQASDLLKQAQPALCLNCHDGLGSSLDVVDGTDTNGGMLRGGGFTTAHIDSADASKTLSSTGSRVSSQIPVSAAALPVTSSHQIDGQTTGTMWGNGTTGVGQTAVTLECGACHDPHGNGNYRILKPSPDGSQYIISPAVPATATTAAVAAVLSPATTVNIPDQPVKVYTTVNYWDVQAVGVPATLNGVALPPISAATSTKAAVLDTDGFLGNISAWCTTCHTRYLSSSGGGTTATTDTVFTYKHRSDEGASNKPNCIQCHVAHGTDSTMTGAAAAVLQPGEASTGTTFENSDLLRVNDRGTCLMCHAVGGPNPLPAVTG
jgi:predicted CXXCH cytochrome family protein